MKYAVIAVALAACTTPKILGPDETANCGQWPQDCGGGYCCFEHEVCGGGPFSGCPAGECCYVGEGDGYAARPSRPQRKVKP